MLPVLLQSTPVPLSAFALCFFPLAAVVFGLITFFVLTDRHATRPYLRYNPFIAATLPPSEAAQRGPQVGETPAGPLGSPAQTTTVYTGGPTGAVVRVPQGTQPAADVPMDYQPPFEGSDQGIGHTRADDAPPRPGDVDYGRPKKQIAEVQPGSIDEPTLNAGGAAITSAFEGVLKEPAVDPNAVDSATTVTNVRRGEAVAPPSGTSAGAATQGVSIVHVEHNPEQVLRGEYVLLRNTSGSPVDMTGWVLRDQGSKHTFTFLGFVLQPGAEVKVWSGRGTNDAENLYWESPNPIWNNTGDTAILEDRDGKVVSRHSF